MNPPWGALQERSEIEQERSAKIYESNFSLLPFTLKLN